MPRLRLLRLPLESAGAPGPPAAGPAVNAEQQVRQIAAASPQKHPEAPARAGLRERQRQPVASAVWAGVQHRQGCGDHGSSETATGGPCPWLLMLRALRGLFPPWGPGGRCPERAAPHLHHVITAPTWGSEGRRLTRDRLSNTRRLRPRPHPSAQRCGRQ